MTSQANANQTKLEKLLEDLLMGGENEVVEFKQAKNDYKTGEIGKYFSAIANEANLHDLDCGWLIFGIDDRTRNVVGSAYCDDDPKRLQGIKMQITTNTSPSITFRNIHELQHPHGRVILFEIPAAPQGLPIAWKGHCYARSGESLIPLTVDKQDEIRKQPGIVDWSAQLIPEAKIEHLDETAILQARTSFARKHANRFTNKDVMQWSASTFLDRAKLTRDGMLVRTTLLLLGKEESVHLLTPHPAQITWKLVGSEQAYQHFGPPFLLNTTKLYQKIRNFKLQIFPENVLLPEVVSKYDQRIVLEALHNCIAHQDYTRNARIIVTEHPDKLLFENEGNFFEGMPEDYITGEKTPKHYRNLFLVRAMTELNMIDMIGYGIYRMHQRQAERYFPMPDYDLKESSIVKMILYGKIVDPAYSRILIQKTDLPLDEIFALDRVQKKISITDEMIKRLRRKKLIEGRKPNLHVSASVAEVTAHKADYIKMRPQDDNYYSKLVTDFIRRFGKASRTDIDKLLHDKLSDALDDDQKKTKIANLLTKMRRKNLIVNKGSRKNPTWHTAV